MTMVATKKILFQLDFPCKNWNDYIRKIKIKQLMDYKTEHRIK